MGTLASKPTLQTDRIKLPLTYDTALMMEEIRALNFRDFIYYNVCMLTHPFRKNKDEEILDAADGSWAEWRDSGFLRDSPYMLSIVNEFRQHCTVTLVRLLRLEAGAVIREHTDPTLGLHIQKSVIRLTIPIQVEKGVDFFLNGTIVPMLPGECWYLRLTDPHQIVNGSQSERINMSIDMVPNEWVRKLILG